MTKSIKRTLLTALIALLPVFTACDSVDEISGAPSGPRHDLLAEGSVESAGGTSSSGSREALRQSVTDTGSVSVWLSAGQSTTLELKGYKLYVPSGARSGQTLYLMSLVPLVDADGNSYQLVRLKAYDKDGASVTTFRSPLSLTIPFGNADPDHLVDASKLRIGYVADGTTRVLQVIQVTIDSANRTMTGQLTHFSDYTPILD